jgi:hypothetical protein
VVDLRNFTLERKVDIFACGAELSAPIGGESLLREAYSGIIIQG